MNDSIFPRERATQHLEAAIRLAQGGHTDAALGRVIEACYALCSAVAALEVAAVPPPATVAPGVARRAEETHR